jgi:ATP-dependent helicase/DNAse subunit B
MPDKYTAVWVSHSSISDWLRCPQAYFLQNVYRDPKTNHKIRITRPSLSLGSAVHEVLEGISLLPKETRFDESLVAKFEDAWAKISGKRGGFLDPESEYRYKMRGQEMLRRVMGHKDILSGPAVKIKEELPHFWLSEEDNIILCGKIDWLEYLPETDSVHIIDFKTGKSEEDPGSLQLPIYHLLVHNCQKRQVTKASYWYVESNDDLTEKVLPDLQASKERVLAIAQEIKVARQLKRFKCPEGDGCKFCQPLLNVTRGLAELVGTDDYGSDIYILPQAEEKESIIL